jgi:hypothetical protein
VRIFALIVSAICVADTIQCGTVGDALSARIPFKDYNRMLAHLIRDQGLSISDGVIFTPRIQIEAVSAAIIMYQMLLKIYFAVTL